ncbi:hypothetical protein KP509_32G031700 [Ceratopteris richardii]|nr:hypothetical protein KP509_32G031700 [Ceratopteris richardii]
MLDVPEQVMLDSGPSPSPLPALSTRAPGDTDKRIPVADPFTRFVSYRIDAFSLSPMINSVSPPHHSIGTYTSGLPASPDISPSPSSTRSTQPSLRARTLSAASSPDSMPPASAPLVPPPSSTPNVSGTSPESPLMPPSGCCIDEMVPKPGLASSSCVCVYPVQLQLFVENVSTTFTNWSGVFQQDLASGLGVKAVQVEITSFQLNISNLTLAIIIGPLTRISFSLEEASSFKSKLEKHAVLFNSSIFGNYSLLGFQLYEPPAPFSMQAPFSGIPPVPGEKLTPLKGASSERHVHKESLLLIIVVATLSVMTILVSLSVFLWKCHQRHGSKGTLCKGETVSDIGSCGTTSIPWSATTRIFTLDELEQATNNFSSDNILGEGGFGQVFKGILKDGTAVAIKRFGGRGHGDREFVVEVEMLSRLHHRNLVKLVGYYVSRDSPQHLLCYELIPNGSLEAWLHGPQGSSQPLDWNTRLKIALDAARGLAYLHEDSQPCVIHRDFKASNILLESDFNAKVADFGLAKLAPEGQVNYVATQVMGTFGYVAPEYAMTGHLLVKSDVYSYGVVLLELLSGRKPVDMSRPSGQENLVTWARPILRDRERIWELVDPRLLDNYPKEDFLQVASIAAACVAPETNQRPDMGEVVQSLRMLQRSSEYISGERNDSNADIEPSSSAPCRSFVTSLQNAHPHVPAGVDSDGSSVFSSGAFSGLVLDHEAYSRSAVFSEDLHEGR